MQIWKLEACRDDERIGCRWGYVVAETKADAIAAGKAATRLPVVQANRMRDGMIWPGWPEETLF